MNLKAARAQCARLPVATFDYPFGDEVRVYRVGGKIFALLTEDGASISLKCDPVLAEMLRRTYHGVRPGYHLNKQHWNTVELRSDVPDAEIREMIRQSHAIVAASLTKAARAKLGL